MAIILQIPRQLYDTMVSLAIAELPNECCGLLAGHFPTGSAEEPVARVARILPLVNEAASPVRYASEPKSLLRAFKEMDNEGLELLAIYHSHPATAPRPSATDRERNAYGPEVVHLIVSLRGPAPEVRGWLLEAAGDREVELRITA